MRLTLKATLDNAAFNAPDLAGENCDLDGFAVAELLRDAADKIADAYLPRRSRTLYTLTLRDGFGNSVGSLRIGR